MDSVELITCKDCGIPFIFTSGESRFYESHGWGNPIRCKNCREKKKQRRQEAEKYFGIHEAIRNSNYTKRDTKGTFINRSGSSWTRIDEVFIPIESIPIWREEDPIWADEESVDF